MTKKQIKGRIIAWTGLALAIVAGSYALRCGPFPTNPKEISAKAASISEACGVQVSYGQPSSFYVPPYTEPEAAHRGYDVIAASPAKMGPGVDAVADSLQIYPKGFFARYCKAIFLCDRLEYSGTPAAGTYGPAWVILAASYHKADKANYLLVRLSLHHEFSSLIWRQLILRQSSWAATMPVGWKPAESNANALRVDGDSPIDPATGFLSPYGATSTENDFNMYAETIFTDPEIILKLAAKYPIIAKKTALFMNAYISVEPRMEQVFAKLKLLPLRAALEDSTEITIKSSAPVQIPRGEVVH